MVYCGCPVNCWRPTFNILISRIPRSAFTRPDNLPRCWCLGDRKALVDAWGLIPDDARALLVDADLKSAAPSLIDLGPKRLFSVAESVLLTARFGPRFCAQVAEVVSLEVESKKYSKMTAAAKEVAAIRYGNSTANSITNYLSSPVVRKRPKLVHKNIKAATVEAAEVAAKVEAAARMEETKRLAAEYEAMDRGAGTEALAQAAEPGDPLRERWPSQIAVQRASGKFCRPARRPPLRRRRSMPQWPPKPRQRRPLLRKTAAAHEASAKAAAAANERRAPCFASAPRSPARIQRWRRPRRPR